MSRGAAPGERRGGREKGTPNRKTLRIVDLLAEQGAEPALGLLRIAKAAEENGDLSLAADCWGKLAQFVYPKPKPMPIDIDEAVLLESRIHKARSEAVVNSVSSSTDGLAERLDRAYKRMAAYGQ